jgi:hypothetical protein
MLLFDWLKTSTTYNGKETKRSDSRAEDLEGSEVQSDS